MSDQLRDELLKRVSEVMSAEDVDSANNSSENEGQRAQAVLARVIENVQCEERPRRHVKRPYWLSSRSFRGRVVVTASVAFAMILLVGVLVSIVGGNSRLDSPITTSRQSGKSLITKQVGSTALPRHGTWLLADGSLSGTWQQIPVGPPGVGVTCPTASACYEMDEVTAAPVENSPLLSVSFYASTDDGVTWTEYSMPRGFSPTTTLSCGSDSDCDAGGTYNGQSVLVSTTNAGHSFTVSPLPTTVGTLFSLSCSSDQFCGGLASEEAPYSPFAHPDALGDGKPTDATFLSTDDGGSTFTSTAITAGNSLWTLECTSSLDCVALGDQGSLSDGTTDWAEGVMETTNDGGNTWTSASLPSGFTVGNDSVLSCADALNCSVSGQISVTFENPPACAANQPSNSPTSLPVNAGTPSSAIEAIVQFESSLINSANLQATPNTDDFGCSWPPETGVSDIVSTTDGGNTWTPEQLPASVVAPVLRGLSCPTDNDCWASGYDENVQGVPDQSVLLGTTDGGSTWSTVTFNGPSFPDGIGRISCPTANVCMANGVGMADAASLPFYRLAIPSSTT
jgi:hypothetical protein